VYVRVWPTSLSLTETVYTEVPMLTFSLTGTVAGMFVNTGISFISGNGRDNISPLYNFTFIRKYDLVYKVCAVGTS